MIVSILISMFGKQAGVALAKVLPYLLGALVIVGMIWFIYDTGHDRGVEVTERKYQVLIIKERTRIQKANQAALDTARQTELTLREELGARNETIKQISLSAARDKDALRRALNADSVLRIDRIH